jgi:hypothetical protein
LNFVLKQNAPNIIGNITYSPLRFDDLDPNTFVQVNATIADNLVGMGTVVFQSYYDGSWHNLSTYKTGDYPNGGNYSANFTTSSVEKNYTIRLYASDAIGNANVTPVANQLVLPSVWDCNWNLSKVSGESLGQYFGFAQKKNSVNFTIFNIGDSNYTDDCGLNFVVMHGLSKSLLRIDDVYGSERGYENITQGRNVTVKLYFNYRNEIFNDLANITVMDDSGKTDYPHLDSVFANFISSSGPYLYQNINDLATNVSGGILRESFVANASSYKVYLTPQLLTLNSSIRNGIGDGTTTKSAYNVSVAWSYNDTFSVLEYLNESNIVSIENETILFFYDNISDGADGTEHFDFTKIDLTNILENLSLNRNYTFNLISSGYNESGNQIIHANNVSVNNYSLNMNFACYLSRDDVCVSKCDKDLLGDTLLFDPDCLYCGDGICNDGESYASCTLDCEAPPVIISTPGNGGGGGGGGSSSASTKIDQSSANFELTRGSENEFEFEVRNKYDSELRNINISVSGINSEYIIIKPTTISSLKSKTAKNISVKINAPAYFTGKKYTLIFEITGTMIDNSTQKETELTDRKSVTLYIVEIPRTQANELVFNATSLLNEMNEGGMILKEAKALFDSINSTYSDVEFGKLKLIYSELKLLHDNAFMALSLIEELTLNLEDAELNGIKATEAKKLLLLGQTIYERGDYALALERLKEAKLTYALEVKGEFNLAYAIKNHPLESFGILLGLGLVSLGSGLLIRLQLLRRKLRMLNEEEVLLLELMKVIQKECFEKNHMSMEEYESAMYQYENRLSETVQEKITVETKIANILKVKGKRIALGEEKARLTSMLRRVQDDYLNKGKIETRIYENMVKSYTARLSEVEEQIATMDADEAMKQSKKIVD